MDINNNLILIKGQDKTASIESWRYDREKSAIFITYIDKYGHLKEYTYRLADIRIYENPKIVNFSDDDECILLKDNSPIRNIQKVQDFGVFSRVFYKTGCHEIVDSSRLSLIQSALNSQKNKKCFDYLKQIASEIGLIVDGYNILENSYRSIKFIREDSALAKFLSGTYEKETIKDNKFVIYPFGFNLSQKKAVENALNNSISIIEGPPGTGKTQTILNIIANAVMKGESVAVVSSNNSATDNVYEKLKKYGVNFIAAPLGNTSNKKAFIESQEASLPNMDDWRDACPSAYEMRELERELNNNLNIQNMLSKTRDELETVQKEYSNFLNYYNTLEIDIDNPIFSKRAKPSEILKYIAEYEELQKNEVELGWWKKFILRVKYAFKKSKSTKKHPKEYIAICQNEYYQCYISKLEGDLNDLKSKLDSFDFEEKMNQYAYMSMLMFKSNLAKKFKKGSRNLYKPEDLWKHSEAFIKDYPVILSTTYSLRASLSKEFVYDYVIVDEASQVDLATGALALSCAKKMVIVGDLKQLPNVVKSEEKMLTDFIFDQFELNEAYRYSTHSLLSSVVNLFPNAPRVLLKEHYRCHRDIIGFCNQRFYNNELIILTKSTSNKKPLVVYRTVPGNHAREHINQRQIDVITNEVFVNQNLNLNDGSVGIVTPYLNQAKELQKVFAGTTVKADTADKFQGQERNVMIFSTVDNEVGDFASDPNRLNVAVSRAIDQFIVVTDGNENDTKSPIHDLIGYISYHNHEIINSEIRSVFDCLYKNYAEARAEIIRKYGRVSEVDSENLMCALIKDVLKKDEYSKYDVVLHVPLRMILSDLTKLNSRELSFATNHLTHVDFLVFSRLTYQPVLVVEVDGFAYHNNARQKERDQVKNSILEKYGIPILRLNTIGSGEMQKFITALENLN